MTLSRHLLASSDTRVESTELSSPLIESTVTEHITPSYAYAISYRYELGDMANLFFNKLGVTLYYIAIILYLYGDMSIYLVTVPKSMLNVTCIIPHVNSSRLNSTQTANTQDCYGFLPQFWLYRYMS